VSPFERIAALTGSAAPSQPAPAPPAEPIHADFPAIPDLRRALDRPAVPEFSPSQPAAMPPGPPIAEAQPAAFPPSSSAADDRANANAAATGDEVKLGLASVLKGCAARDIGISPDHIPSWVQTTLPLSLIQPQLASGKVSIRLADILRGLEPEMRHLLAPTRHDLEVVVPANDLFHALPVAKAGAAPPDASKPSPAIAEAIMPSPAPQEVTMPAGVPWPFETAAHAEPATPDLPTPAPAAVVESAFSAFSLPSLSAMPAPTSTPPEGPFQVSPPPAPAEVPPPPPAPALEAPFQAFAPPAASAPLFNTIADRPFETFAPKAAPAPLPEAHAPSADSSFLLATPASPAPVSVVRSAALPRVTRDSDKRRQMLLRVLLGSQEEAFDANAVIRLTTGQPGVAAAVCFQDGKPVASSGNGSPEGENFLRQAQRRIEQVLPLVELTGIQDTETVSMKSDRHVITFSLQGRVTLAVLHDPQQQEPTLREKVTLIARELTGLLQAA
jgi:hypothetical protein